MDEIGQDPADFLKSDMRNVALRPIAMQDIRLAVGEGKLSASDVLAGCNAELLRRSHLVHPQTSSDPRDGADMRVPTCEHDDLPTIFTLRIQVLDPTSLHQQARTAFLKVGPMENVGRTLGSPKCPDLKACLVEIIADQDHAGILDFPD